MADWGVLRLAADPAPGDPAGVRDLARRFFDEADLASRATARLRSVASSGDRLRLVGDYAASYHEALAELPGELAKIERSYRRCGEALSAFSTSLDSARSAATTALRRGQDADLRSEVARSQVRTLLPPDRYLPLGSPAALHDATVDAATVGLDPGLRQQIRTVVQRVRYAEADRDAARRLALQAAQLRGEAEDRAAGEIGASSEGIRNKSWLRKAWDVATTPFRSWDGFVDFCRDLGTVLSVAALFLTGPVGWAVVAAAIVLAVVVAADTYVKFRQGRASGWDLAADLVAVIPGKPGGGRALISAWRKGLPTAARRFSGGISGLSTTLRAWRGSAAGAWPSLRRALAHEGPQSRPFLCRVFGLDPVDVATGEVVVRQTDVALPGVLPLVLERTYSSTYRSGRWFGPGWASSLDQRLEVSGDDVLLARPDGGILRFPRPDGGSASRPVAGPRLELREHPGGFLVVNEPGGPSLWFRAADWAGERGGEPVLPLVAVTDRNGNRLELDHSPHGELFRLRHSGGYTVRVDVRDERVVALRLDRPDGTDTTLVRYGYGDDGRLSEVVNSCGPLRFGYDDAGRLVRWEDRNLTAYEYVYDEDGRCVRTAGTNGVLEGRLAYDDSRGTTAVTDALGRTTVHHRNDRGQVVRTVDPEGNATLTEWDAFHAVRSRTDATGATTRYEYDREHRLVAVERPDSSRVTLQLDAAGDPVAVTAADGATWQYARDGRGNVLRLVEPTGAVTAFGHDEAGRLVSVTDPLGAVTGIVPDAAGLPARVTDPLGAVTELRRDAFGRVVEIEDAAGGVTALAYSPEGLLTERRLPSGAVERWEYDGEGNETLHVDAAGNVTRTEWAPFDVPAARIRPDGSRLLFTHDAALQLVAVTDPAGRMWRFEYDRAGAVTREVDVNGRSVAYRRDALGRVAARTNGAGETVEYEYDVLGSLVLKRAGRAVTEYAYDPVGRLVRASTPDVELELVRDATGRVVAEVCDGRAIRFGHDAAGRRTSRTTPAGTQSSWRYDAAGRPSALDVDGHAVAFAHDVLGREVERVLGPALRLQQTWAAADGWLEAQTVEAAGRVVQRRSYHYDVQARLVHVEDRARGRSDATLDVLGRVTELRTVRDGATTTESYAYDPGGSLSTAAWSPSGAPDDAAGLRELVGTRVRRAGRLSYEHDRQGRVTARRRRTLSGTARTWHYTWDAEDRLTAVTTPDGATWRYRYDGLGRRVAKQRVDVDGFTVLSEEWFAWDGALLAERMGTRPDGTTQVVTWEWHPDEPRPLVQRERRAEADGPAPDGPAPDAPGMPGERGQDWYDERFYAIVTDLLGTPTELVDGDGEIVWQPRTTLWGLPSGSADGVRCPLRFPGQYADDETGLHYNVLRYYDPAIGTYLSPDPLGLAAGPDPHAYVPDPRTWMDPLGLTPCERAAAKAAGLTRVYRVEETAFARLHIDVAGNVAIKGDAMLFLNFGDEARAQEFLAQRLEQGRQGVVLKFFDVPTSYAADVASRAVPESMGRGASVIWVDMTKTESSYGLRSTEFPGLQRAIVPGSGR